jgi:hypothetical protein
VRAAWPDKEEKGVLICSDVSLKWCVETSSAVLDMECKKMASSSCVWMQRVHDDDTSTRAGTQSARSGGGVFV